MTGIGASLLSMLSAGVLFVSTPLLDAAPQHNLNNHMFLANRVWRLSESFVPVTVVADVPGQVRRMSPDAAAALEEMFAAAKKEQNITLVSVSGYRAYSKQKIIYNRKLKSVNGSVARADEYVARPGASQHQLGLAMDVGQKGKEGLLPSFGKTKGGQWLRENCARFGFILRYQEGWQDVTGYSYEPWHIRYVGQTVAQAVEASGLPYETWLIQYRKQLLLEIVGE